MSAVAHSNLPSNKARFLVRALKAIAILLASLVVFVVAAFYIALHLIDFNKYQPILIEELHQQWGVEAEFEGELRVEKWPFGLILDEVNLQGQWQNVWWQAELTQLKVDLSLSDLVRQQRAKPQALSWSVSRLAWGELHSKAVLAELTDWHGQALQDQHNAQAWSLTHHFDLAGQVQTVNLATIHFDPLSQTLQWQGLDWYQTGQVNPVMMLAGQADWQSSLSWQLQGELAQLDPAQLAYALGLDWADLVNHREVSRLTGELSITGPVSVNPVSLLLDETKQSGWASIDFTRLPPKIHFERDNRITGP